LQPFPTASPPRFLFMYTIMLLLFVCITAYYIPYNCDKVHGAKVTFFLLSGYFSDRITRFNPVEISHYESPAETC
jgi:hypothetical protein